MNDFYPLCQKEITNLHPDESISFYYQGETSDFCRFNQGLIRQVGTVSQHCLTISLTKNQRQAQYLIDLSLDNDRDALMIKDAISNLRDYCQSLPIDPFLTLPEQVISSQHYQKNQLPKPIEAVDDILNLAGKLDFVGILGIGTVSHGFFNSMGQQNWYDTHFYDLDASIYHQSSATKMVSSGFEWNRREIQDKLSDNQEFLQVMATGDLTLKAGQYRVYLAPAAVESIINLINWGGFSKKAAETKVSPLSMLINGKKNLSEKLTIIENTENAMAPPFDRLGFKRPTQSTLIAKGAHAGHLVSSRSAKEFQIPSTGANFQERGESLDVDTGELEKSDILSRIQDGIYISNLWYLNYSDQTNCRITGMTRFATMRVKNGKLVGPIKTMRFDESIYRILGTNLKEVTSFSDLVPSTSTYGSRSTDSIRVPGLLIDSFTFTL